MMNDIMDDQKVEFISATSNCIKLWKDYSVEEREVMEAGNWYLLNNVEEADVLCVVI